MSNQPRIRNAEQLNAILTDLNNRIQLGQVDQRNINSSNIATSLLLQDVVAELQTLNETFQIIRDGNNNTQESESDNSEGGV